MTLGIRKVIVLGQVLFGLPQQGVAGRGLRAIEGAISKATIDDRVNPTSFYD